MSDAMAASIVEPLTHNNPFPGLRPFQENEEHLFFGRERQIDDMIDKLAGSRFLAVVGTSGSGKSSLVNCGLRPALHRGHMTSAGPSWRMAQFRPGSGPLTAMVKALAADDVLYSGYQGGIPLEEIIDTHLRLSPLGLIEIFRKARLPAQSNLLVVVDQFEELFRYSKLAASHPREQYGASSEAIALVNLLLEVRNQPVCRIHVVVTMRSDFLGDCAHFHGLPEAINAGQYLVPRMTRDERRAAIAVPVGVAGGEISPVLLTRLVNDVGDNPDQLSILQHALNRTWAYWKHEGHGEGAMSLDHYEAIGTMAHALDQHAEKAYGDLGSDRQKKICEKIFKALTDKGTDPRGIRRPTSLASLCAIAGAAANEVIEVVNVFRKPSRSFLMPPLPEVLEPASTIDISHESLMRVWKRLNDWADEEARSSGKYRRLVETAELHKRQEAGLWRDPELQRALEWRQREEPTAAWGECYQGNFDSAMAFLETSKQARDRELAELEMERRWRQIRSYIASCVVVGGLIAYERVFHDSDQFKDSPRQLQFAAVALYLLLVYLITNLAKRILRRLLSQRVLKSIAGSSARAAAQQYAGFWRRLAASAIDLTVFFVMLVLVLFEWHGDESGPYALCLFFLADWLYQTLVTCSRPQGTLGKLAMGLYVTRGDGSRLSFARATARYFARYLSGLTVLGYFLQLFTKRNQSLHDWLTGSAVRRQPTRQFHWITASVDPSTEKPLQTQPSAAAK